MVNSAAPKVTALAVAAALASAGCVDDVLGGPPYRAQVVDVVDINPENSRPSFALVERDFELLDDIETLSSPYLQVFRGGELYIHEVGGRFVADRMTADPYARLRYAAVDGVAVPRDYPTLAMLSAYYHYERILLDLERVTGLTQADLLNRFGKVEVFFEPAFRVKGFGINEREVFKHNAFYLPGARQFGIAQRARAEGVPFAVNQMVAAHEFGHALFELTFEQGGSEFCSSASFEDNVSDPLFPGRFRVEYAISGINEGFADFISFAYTGATNALGDQASAGERNFADLGFNFAELIPPEDGNFQPPCFGQFYCIGTLFASALYRTMIVLGYDPLDPEDRGEYSRVVMEAMATAKDAIYDLPAGVVPLPDEYTAFCRRHEGFPREIDGGVTGAFLAGFVAQMPEEAREPLCTALTTRFGNLGFPESARLHCPSDDEDDEDDEDEEGA
jgi:hypothetical protein